MLDDMGKSTNTAIIVAAGTGSRLGSDIPKQFLTLNGREILSYSVETFSHHPNIDHTIIVTSADYFDKVAEDYPECHVVLGGETRQESVANGLRVCPEQTDLVLVHDAARPLIGANIIDHCLELLKTLDGVAPAIKPNDSMVQIEGDDFLALDRGSLRIIQTPQCFHLQVLKKAHGTGVIDTDEIGLVSRSVPSAQIGFVEGSAAGMKITTSMDLEFLELLLAKGNSTA